MVQQVKLLFEISASHIGMLVRVPTALLLIQLVFMHLGRQLKMAHMLGILLTM